MPNEIIALMQNAGCWADSRIPGTVSPFKETCDREFSLDHGKNVS